MSSVNIHTLNIHIGSPRALLSVLPADLQYATGFAPHADDATRFSVSEDGSIVTDSKTGLMWSQANVGAKGNFEKAEKAVAECRLGGHADWRMPTREELESILDLTRSDPAIDPVFACDSSWYWSSTAVASAPAYAWFVLFAYGDVNGLHRGSGGAFVRAVRSSSPAGQ
ncbi:DUF1566 domain-containing protein [Luteibacter aegosomaticola]|uniref:Lcl C-terminal domain-containing protein n=1 Tax=Luteibacter aegosomaticola TaxID=2911538 RepID=UPI001FFB0E71|nr:DUF1566 domain-containing protein [Luteibacter aegosomaticola]UPG89313.1 DUF1566 domain-containing protein [Luteibacter aegosomaticola]